jgi:pyruvate,orthophosphate dikinase
MIKYNVDENVTSSKAFQVNLDKYRVDVTIDTKYHVIQDVMSKYYGLQKALNTFLEELCHPYKNWQFIVSEARTFSLGYFYDLKTHPKGQEATRLYVEIAIEAIKNAQEPGVKTDAFNNLYSLLQKIVKESGSELNRFLPVLNYGFDKIKEFPDETFFLIAKSYYQLKKLAGDFLKNVPPGPYFHALNSLLIRYFEYTFSYWLSENDPQEWFERDITSSLSEELSDLFKPVSHSEIETYYRQLNDIVREENDNSAVILKKLLELPGYGDLVNLYKSLPEKIFEVIVDEKLKHHYKLISLFHTMNISGLSHIHEETLGEINRSMVWLINHEDFQHIKRLIQKTFGILKGSVVKFPNTVLRCILNMGIGVYKTDESDLVHFFNQSVVQLGFQTPDFKGIDDTWRIQSNIFHIQNIRTWMELIKLNPKWSKKLLSSLIIYLSLEGVLIKDTDLFPRDITGFLNSDIQPVYNLTKQLMRLLPAYFNEIGAEGQIRDISTKIDEVCQRKDVLIHFLRKQSHVESSNTIILFIEATLDFWKTKSKEWLKPYLPQNIYDQIELEGPYINGVNKVINHIFQSKKLVQTSELLTLKEDSLMEVAGKIPEDHKLDIERVALAISFYKLLNEKYCTNSCDIEAYSARVQSSIPLRLDGLRDILSTADTFNKLSGLLGYLQQLKNIILSPEPFKVREDIYRKRHIAAGIPSMYGSYHEAKFDALGLTFRLEALVNTLFEELIEKFDLNFITHATFYQIYQCLKLFNQALYIDGVSTREFEHQLDLLNKSLKIKLVTFTQYMDIFRGFTQVVRNTVSDYFHNMHEQNLWEISNYMPIDKLLPKYLHESESRKELFDKVSEIFLRNSVASSLGLQRLDLFLSRILNTLYKQAEKLPIDKHYLLLTYNPRNVVTSIAEPDSKLLDIVHLGNKGFNIVKMESLGLPIPPGFIITTEVFRCRELIVSYPPARKNFREHIDREISDIEKLTGKTFGAPENSLLVSVRSGATVSQPGMMDSYLNVGMNDAIVNGIIKQTGEEWFAWDCYRRFLQSYGMSFGIIRDNFDAIINEFKMKYSVPLKRDFTPHQIKEVAMAYKELILSHSIKVEESPREQLYIAIQQVLNSWNSAKAHTYRKIMKISDDWGTAVTIQAMVFGNLSQQAGSGVLFTHSPKFSTDVLRPWGDYTIGNQGEDVVSGLVTTYPVSIYQAKMENRPLDFALENKFPYIYQTMREIAKVLIYENKWSPQDIEFTFEGPQKKELYILQTRNMEMRERKRFLSFESTAEMSEKFLGHGIGVSGGALSGRVVFSLDDISHWRKIEPETSLILVRGDTVPDDIHEISLSDGLLTARGGATSHAAIVANRLNKTCVVGCTDLVCMEKDKKFFLNQKTVNVGQFISIDGSEGSIYFGEMRLSKGENE